MEEAPPHVGVGEIEQLVAAPREHRLQRPHREALDLRAKDGSFELWLEGQLVANASAFADAGSRDAAMARVREALAV